MIDSSLIDTVQNLDIFDLCAQMPDQSIDMILCDLPYGTTACSWDTVIPFEPMWAAFRRVIKPRGAIVLTASQPFTSALVMSNPAMFRYEWIWRKNQPTGYLDAPEKPLKLHENVCVFYQQQPTYNPQMIKGISHKRNTKGFAGSIYGAAQNRAVTFSDEFYPTSIINFDVEHGLHPTQKAVKLFEYLIRTYTREGEVVFDPCCGSGTTALAARNAKRHYICGDQSAEYVAIARDRLRLPFEPRQRPLNDDLSGLPLFASVLTSEVET